MLGVSTYPKEYIDSARAAVQAQLAAYEQVRGTEAFEPLFFNHMVLALDHYFCHRLRGREGKDGNALNEVRVLCTSIMEGGGRLVADKTIKLKAATSLLHHGVGDEIRLNADDFRLLADAFFAELEARYT
jgi:hypothetical protein